MLKIEGSWVWDFWIADDGDLFHLFFLHAPTSLCDETRRHRAARIGHAVSTDLHRWELRDAPFGPGLPGQFDETATWTGSVIRDSAGMWWMFYTGARFLSSEPDQANIETIGAAVSTDLDSWTKLDSPLVSADPRWYERWGTGAWKEESWRDPWVFPDPRGDGYRMLLTARANHGSVDARGVVGHARSRDLRRWEVLPPLSAPGAGFAHVEVPQLVDVDGSWVLLFACSPDAMTAAHASRFADAGTWVLLVDDPAAPFDLSAARPLTGSNLYSGRLVQQRDGSWVLLAFESSRTGGSFSSAICDPIPFTIADGEPRLGASRPATAAGPETSPCAAGAHG
ncbi:MAG: hypothetical protein QM711_03875 [Micropruina sp.]|uniref:hypothetical protein n=1 Tax=Micropruina sp. TaxID=2737536 RepID=UPI0039E33666